MRLSSIPLASLLTTATLTLADTDADLGYLKCATAAVQDLSFPECTSTHALDCFCAALEKGRKWGRNEDEDASLRLSPVAEAACVRNGVAPAEIPAYLCNDANVPVSPRRGSTPMVRLGEASSSSSLSPLSSQDREEEEEREEREKRSMMQLDEVRLLIPERARAKQEEEGTEEQEVAEHRQTADSVFQVISVTVTKTKTVCACAPTPLDPSSGVVYFGTAVDMPSSEAGASTVVSSSASAGPFSVVGGSVPTGFDAAREEGAEGEDQRGSEEGVETFEGGAVGWVVSRGIVVGVAGVMAGMALL